MYKEFLILVLFLLLTHFVSAQNAYSDSARVLGSTIIEGDTLPNYDIAEVKVFPEKVLGNSLSSKDLPSGIHQLTVGIIKRELIKVLTRRYFSEEGRIEE